MLDTTDAKAEIKQAVDTHDVVLFMKGTATMPQCGFSSRVAAILNYMGVEFADFNILQHRRAVAGSVVNYVEHNALQ